MPFYVAKQQNMFHGNKLALIIESLGLFY